MVNLTINHQAICVEEGITIMEAARQNRIKIPHLCYIKDIHQMGACRICVVEVEGLPALQASCMTTVEEGMVVHTNTKQVRDVRRVLYELMLSDHDADCLSCARNQSCEFQALGKLLGVETSRFEGARSTFHVDASTSITRDMSKCILCRRCVTACNDLQGTCVLSPQNRGFNTEIAPALNLPIGTLNCSMCGQCTVVCPVSALKETSSTQMVWDAIGDPEKRVVVQVAPAVRVALGEEFGLPAGTRVTGKIAAALRSMGFDDIFDTNFGADLTIMEEGAELLARLKDSLSGGKAVLPMMTSCSPGWIKYVEHHHPNKLNHLSSCKSPHTMLGALTKTYYSDKADIKPVNIFTVSVMPCTAKKTEIAREEMKNGGLANIDAVITTRELAEMIKSAGIDFCSLPDEAFDQPLGISTGASDLFGLAGGVTEAALRTVHGLVTGRPLPFDRLYTTPVEGLEPVEEAELLFEDVLPEYRFLEGVTLRVAVTSGLSGAKELMKHVASGNSPYHFIEVMGCPGGCIMGGGQPRSEDPEVRSQRLTGLTQEDSEKELRASYENPFIQSLYNEFLGEPGGYRSRELLHTSYVRRGNYNELTEETFVRPAPRVKSGRKLVETQVITVAATESAAPKADSGGSRRVMELEAENQRLQDELKDALETVEILKAVLS